MKLKDSGLRWRFPPSTNRSYVHIGDRLELDVLGARRSNLGSVLYAPGGECCQDGMPRPDFCIRRLAELIENQEELLRFAPYA